MSGGVQMSKKEHRYQAYTIDGHIVRPCHGDTLEELNRSINNYSTECKYQPYFVRDNVKEKWL